MEPEKEIILRCTIIPKDSRKYGYSNYHDIDSKCAEEERYEVEGRDNCWSTSKVKIINVRCFDCLVTRFCQKDCTNYPGLCRICSSKMDFCSECSEKETGYASVCTECKVCKYCFNVCSQYQYEPPECSLEKCRSCGELVCSEKIHRILDCILSEAPDIHELKDYFNFLQKQILELKLLVIEVENKADRADCTAIQAENGVTHLENRGCHYRGGYY